MRWFCLLSAVVSFISFMNDLALVQLSSLRIIPIVGNKSPTVLTLLFFLFTIGLLLRMLSMERKGEKEKLREQIKNLEDYVKELKKE